MVMAEMAHFSVKPAQLRNFDVTTICLRGQYLVQK